MASHSKTLYASSVRQNFYFLLSLRLYISRKIFKLQRETVTFSNCLHVIKSERVLRDMY